MMEKEYTDEEINQFCQDIKSNPDLPDFGDYLTGQQLNQGVDAYAQRHGNDPKKKVAFLIGRKKIQRMLLETDCDGFRIYYYDKATSNGVSYEMAVVPVDADGNDILLPVDKNVSDGDCYVTGDLRPCPFQCSGG